MDESGNRDTLEDLKQSINEMRGKLHASIAFSARGGVAAPSDEVLETSRRLDELTVKYLQKQSWTESGHRPGDSMNNE